MAFEESGNQSVIWSIIFLAARNRRVPRKSQPIERQPIFLDRQETEIGAHVIAPRTPTTD